MLKLLKISISSVTLKRILKKIPIMAIKAIAFVSANFIHSLLAL